MRAQVVGLGSAGRRHAENLRTLGVEVVTKDPDVEVIATPTAFHVPHLIRALERGRHVYMEKPIAPSMRQLGNLQVNGRVIAVGYQFRFNECLQRVKAALSEWTLGRLVHVHVDTGEYLPSYHPNEDYRKGYAARSDMGGGVLLTQIHDINYLQWLLGPFESVYAIGGKISELEIDVEDSVSFIAHTAVCPITVHMDYLQRPLRRTMVLTGERATLTWDYYANTLMLSDIHGQMDIGPGVPLDRNAMFLAAMADFLSCVETGGRPATGIREAIADVAVVDAIRESFTAEKAVRVNHELD